MSAFFHVLQVLVAIGLVGLVLIQHGKGADAGAAFGSGASATVFGSQGSGNFLSRATAVLAALFFLNSLILAYFSTQVSVPESVITSLPVQEAPAPEPMTPSKLPMFPEGQPAIPPTTGNAPVSTIEMPATLPASSPSPAAPVEKSTDAPEAAAPSVPPKE